MDDAISVDEDDSVEIDEMANDFDVDGDTIYIVGISTAPTKGRADIDYITGKITYTPDPNLNGTSER